MIRRGVLIGLAVLTAAVGVGPVAVGGTDPFPHGIAARATVHSVTVWTRAGGPAPYTVQISKNKALTGAVPILVSIDAARDNTIRKTIGGLEPNTRYYYRFTWNGTTSSELGTFRTLPNPKRPAALELSYSGDSDILWQEPPEGSTPERDFAVLDRIREDRSDFFIYMGDTIYSDSETGAPLAETRAEKWAKYKANRVEATTEALASVSTWAVWDDHEVINDFDGKELRASDPALFKAGRRAFVDYWPLPRTRFYRKVDFGSEIDLLYLDERTYRDESADKLGDPCYPTEEEGLDLAPTMPKEDRAALGLDPVDPECLEHLKDPSRSYLGNKQMEWLKERLKNSNARWKLIINEVAITELFVRPYDRWEGYPGDRNELLRFIDNRNIKNVVFLTTDLHANAGAYVYKKITADGAKPVATEFISGPIQTCSLDCEVEVLLGFEGAGTMLTNHLLGNKLVKLIGPDPCINIDHYGYATVSIPKTAEDLAVRFKSHEADPDGPGGLPMPECEEPIVLP